MEKNSNTILKILIGVIVLLSAILLISGILYVRGIQNKISKLEKEQEEQLKKEVENQKIISMQLEEKQKMKDSEEKKAENTTKNTVTQTQTQNSIKKGSIFITKSTSGPVNVRAEASMNSEIIERLRDNVILKYVSSKGNWYYIVYNIRGYNEYGYIHKSQLIR